MLDGAEAAWRNILATVESVSLCLPFGALQSAFAPVVWSTIKNETDPVDGYWRSGGTGMIALFVSELEAMGGQLPMISRVAWGGEDHKLVRVASSLSGRLRDA